MSYSGIVGAINVLVVTIIALLIAAKTATNNKAPMVIFLCWEILLIIRTCATFLLSFKLSNAQFLDTISKEIEKSGIKKLSSHITLNSFLDVFSFTGIVLIAAIIHKIYLGKIYKQKNDEEFL